MNLHKPSIRRNPFVNQVFFVEAIKKFSKTVNEARRNPFVNQVFFVPGNRLKKW